MSPDEATAGNRDHENEHVIGNKITVIIINHKCSSLLMSYTTTCFYLSYSTIDHAAHKSESVLSQYCHNKQSRTCYNWIVDDNIEDK